MISRFQDHEYEGRTPVLLYCGDFDPAGLRISDFITSNIDELFGATGWYSTNLIVDRFGLDYEFIIENKLTWIENLETGRDKRKGVNDLSDPKHPDHYKEYVQRYLSQYGSRKVEANAIVVVPDMGRQLCCDAINKYIPPSAVQAHKAFINKEQLKVKDHVLRLLGG